MIFFPAVWKIACFTGLPGIRLPCEQSPHADWRAQQKGPPAHGQSPTHTCQISRRAYPQLDKKEFDSLSDLLTATGDEFIFVIDAILPVLVQ